MTNLYFFLAFSACQKDKDGVTSEDYVPPQELTLPDLSNIDIDAAFEEALSRTRGIQLSPAWNANRAVLEIRHDGCPDIYAGAPEDAEMEEGGLSWSDFCRTAGGLGYSGFMYWGGTVNQSGSPDSPNGYSLTGTRNLGGEAVVTAGNDILFEFRGEGDDSLNLIEAEDYRRWTYSSTMRTTLSGSEAVGEGEGYRSDMYIYASGGDVDYLEARGNAYWGNYRIQDHFDSVGMDLVLSGENGAGPDDCTLEPKGWFGIRDENAYWYDLVFMPKDADDTTDYLSDEHSVCDGCGTLYLRGIETENYGTICPDFSNLWIEDVVSLPTADDFLLTLQHLEELGQ